MRFLTLLMAVSAFLVLTAAIFVSRAAFDDLNARGRSTPDEQITGSTRAVASGRYAAAIRRSYSAQRLEGVSFAYSDLHEADFSSAILSRTSFVGANLQGANFESADLRHADFSGAILDRANFVQAKLQGTNFAGASMKKVTVSNAEMEGTNFSGADLEGADLNGWLRGINFHRANLRGALFGLGTSTLLEGANLSEAKLEGAYFEGVFLAGADLRGAKLQGATFGGSGRSSDFQGANLESAELQGADLNEVLFRGASLSRALVWRTQNKPELDLTDTTGIELKTAPHLDWGNIRRAIAENPWKKEQLAHLRLVDTATPAPHNVTPAGVWTKQNPGSKDLAEFLADLACRLLSGNSPSEEQSSFVTPMEQPYIARGLLTNGRLIATGRDITIFADRARAGRTNPSACPGVAGFTDRDWALLDDAVASQSH